jgi:hypothetical protein
VHAPDAAINHTPRRCIQQPAGLALKTMLPYGGRREQQLAKPGSNAAHGVPVDSQFIQIPEGGKK